MRTAETAVAVPLTVFAGFFLAASVLMTGEPGFAQARRQELGSVARPPAASDDGAGAAGAVGCSCSNGAQPPASNTGPIPPEQRERLWPKPALADLKSTLDDTDAVAALEAVQMALTEVGDGATYIWHRRHGRLSGAIQPTSSFKDSTGHVCRHIVMALTSGSYSRKAEGIACRLSTGVWVLEG